jgi:hypothetical protein
MSFVLPVSAAWISFIVAGTVAILLARSHGPVVRAAVVAGLYRPQYGTWFVLRSSSNYTQYGAYGWGAPGDTLVPADYDGDGKTDIAVYRPTTGEWFVRPSGGTSPWSVVFGKAGDLPLAAR